MSKMKQRNDIHCVMTEKGLVCENTWIFTTGRIKRMRKGESKCNGILRRIHGTSIVITRNDPYFYEQILYKITRWTRH